MLYPRLSASHLAKIALAASVLTLSACGGGGSGSGAGGVNPPTDQSVPPKPLAFKSFGYALFSDDSSATDAQGNGKLELVQLYDSAGNLRPSLTLQSTPVVSGYDIESLALAPDASTAVFADGARQLRFITGLDKSAPQIATRTLDISSYGTDVDAVVMLPTGDAAIAAPDTNNALIVVTGIRSGQPAVSATIPTPDLRNGLVLSNDTKTLLARGYSGITAYAVGSGSPATFAQTGNLTNVPGLDSADGRAGMAISPVDSTRGVAVGHGPAIAMLNGLSSAPSAQSTPISGAHNAYAAAISPDGKTAYVGTDNGIAVFSGVDTGTLTQTQFYQPPLSGGAQLAQISSIALTLDGRALVVVGVSSTAQSATNGYLEVLPILNGTLGAPLATLSGVAVPESDQLLIH
jgi:hypothetical protein